MSDQIKEILEYRPQVLERTVETELPEESNPTLQMSFAIEEKNCINDLKENAPSACLKQAEAAISKAKSMINGIIDSYTEDPNKLKKVRDFKLSLETDDYAAIDEFEKVAITDKAGDPKLEVLAPLYYMNKTMEKMKEIMVVNNYGSNVNYDTALEMDNDLFSIIDNAEENGNSITNYTAVSLDAIIGNGMITYFDDCLNFMESIQDIIEPSVNTSPEYIPVELRSMMDATFLREVDTFTKDHNKLRQIDDSSMKEQLAVNMYKARETLLKNETLGSSILSLGQSSLMASFMGQLQESTTEAFSIILDFHKHSAMESMYREDFATTLERKQSVRELFG